MVLEGFLQKYLASDFEAFGKEDLEIVKANEKVFGIGKEAEETLKELATVDPESESGKAEWAKRLKETVPPRTVVIKALDSNELAFGDESLDFRMSFYSALEGMDNLRTCYLIDKMGAIMRRHRIAFFGNNANNESVYHQFNEVVSKAYGLDLVFGVFGKDCAENFLRLRFERFDKALFADCFRRNVRNYYCILAVLAGAIAETEKENLGKKSLTYAIGKGVGPFVKAIKDEKELFRNKGQKLERKWVYSDSDLASAPASDGGDDDEEG